jgi:hypothetical protein
MTIDFVTVMGRLLCDPSARQRFVADRQRYLSELELDSAAREALLSVDTTALERQAAVLLNKRRHEVRKLLPETMARLGNRATAVFDDFASSNWPTSHRRHVEDAVAFGDHLARRQPHAVARAEINRLAFLLSRRRFAVAWLTDYAIYSRHHFALQLLIRKQSRPVPVEHIWFLRWPSGTQRQPSAAP